MRPGGWDDAVLRRSLTALATTPQTVESTGAFVSYWTGAIDDAETAGDLNGVEHDVLLEDVHAAVRALPGVSTRSFSSGASLDVPFTVTE
jgi:hypothetical protein